MICITTESKLNKTSTVVFQIKVLLSLPFNLISARQTDPAPPPQNKNCISLMLLKADGSSTDLMQQMLKKVTGCK